MIRRSLLVAGALVAALAVSSCSTFNRTSAVAEVNGHQLSRSVLQALINSDTSADVPNPGDATSGANARFEISKWVTVAVLGGDVSGVASVQDLASRRTKVIDEISAPLMDTARGRYAKGLDGSPVLCLAAIPLAGTTAPDTVLAELKAGATFADTAKKYSTDANIAQSGGLIQDQNGASCLAPTGFNPALVTAMKTAGATPGTPTTVDLTGSKAIILLRPFDELGQADKAAIVQPEIGVVVKDRLGSSKVYVSPLYGHWDTKSLTIVALEQS